MKVRDRTLNKDISVSERNCPLYKCYWPRPNPGSFVHGRGYHSYGDSRDKEWICGNRDIHGCPKEPQLKVRKG